MIKKIILFLFPFLLFAKIAKAVCPVCTVAVCAGVGLSRWLGIDDLITGIWIGGLTVSVIIWTLDWFGRKQINFIGKIIITTLVYYLFILGSLHFTDILWHPLNKFWGVDKILFGTIIGTFIFLFSVWFHNFLKRKNNDKSYFPYQKVAIPILFLIIISLIFYYLIS